MQYCSHCFGGFFFHFVTVSVYINNWRCQQSLKFFECLSPGLLDQKNLKCSTKMWQRQHSTLHWGGALCDGGGGMEKEPACSVQTLSHSDPWWHKSVFTASCGGLTVQTKKKKNHEIPSSWCSFQLQQFRHLSASFVCILSFQHFPGHF